jgi:ubiquinone/menaquinone biosynthesis C-methylase UbiE
MFSNPDTVIGQMFISEGMSVADFGCGMGFYTLRLAKKVGHYGRVFAIDSHPDYLRKIKNEAVKSGHNQVEVVQGDLEMPSGSGLLASSIDRIIISNTLFQSEDPKAIISEARRVLKHDGKVAVIDWSDSFGQIGPHADHVLPEKIVKAMFEECGFAVISEIDAGSHHYGFLYKLKQ